MAHTGVTNLLLFLALVISTILGINGADSQCQIMNATANSTSAFNLTVSPEKLSNNASYTVHLAGSGNATVILQALSSSNSVGNWSNGNISCSGSPLFQNPFENGNQLQAQWTSPENVASVNITAYIHNDNGTFVVSRTLSQDSVSPTATTNQTTIAPNSSNSTANTSSSSSSSSSATATTVTTVKTTSASSAVQTSLLSVALFQIFGLLIITSK